MPNPATRCFQWKRDDGGAAGFTCKMPNEVTLFAVPDRMRFGKPARGTAWRAGASQFDGKSTISRFGRDVYGEMQPSAVAAKLLAERVYLEVIDAKGA